MKSIVLGGLSAQYTQRVFDSLIKYKLQYNKDLPEYKGKRDAQWL
jgi:hypothetical protein